MQHVAILGASNKPARYSHKAQLRLTENGHTIYPVSNHEIEILGVKCFASLRDIKQKIDTVTVYLNPENLLAVADDLLVLMPRRVIFNPGSESLSVMTRLDEAGIAVQTACTLVLLATDQFDQD